MTRLRARARRSAESMVLACIVEVAIAGCASVSSQAPARAGPCSVPDFAHAPEIVTTGTVACIGPASPRNGRTAE